MMKCPRVVALSCAVFCLAVSGWNSGQNSPPQKSNSLEAGNAAPDLQIRSSVLQIEFDHNLHSRVSALFGANPKPLTALSASETVAGINQTWSDFNLTSSHREAVSDVFGAGERLLLTGKSGDLRKSISVTLYADFPSLAIFDVEYTNEGTTPLAIRGWANHQYALPSLPNTRGPAFWSYQSGSYEKRPNWVVPLRPGFYQKNYLGMNASDYGGGTPVIDVWRKDVGLAVGHI